MNVNRHRNLVDIFQFIGFAAYLIAFISLIDFLKEYNAFNPAAFLIGPIITVIIIRLVMIFYFPPDCTNNDCNGKMYLHLTRNRRYACPSCGSKFELVKLKNDATTKKRVNKLLLALAAIILMFVILAIIGIIKNTYLMSDLVTDTF